VTVQASAPLAVTFVPAGTADVSTVGVQVVQPAGDDAA